MLLELFVGIRFETTMAMSLAQEKLCFDAPEEKFRFCVAARSYNIALQHAHTVLH
jgi:hypothetical protein